MFSYRHTINGHGLRWPNCFWALTFAGWLVAATALAQPSSASPMAAPAQDAAAPGGASSAPSVPVSDSAQRLYQSARSKLLQVRTLVNGQSAQSSVGSGFLVSTQGHILTNYHVVSQAALEPKRYRLSYSMAQGGDDLFDPVMAEVRLNRPTPLAPLIDPIFQVRVRLGHINKSHGRAAVQSQGQPACVQPDKVRRKNHGGLLTRQLLHRTGPLQALAHQMVRGLSAPRP